MPVKIPQEPIQPLSRPCVACKGTKAELLHETIPICMDCVGKRVFAYVERNPSIMEGLKKKLIGSFKFW